MGLPLELVTIRQEFDLESGDSYTYLQLRLPSGDVVPAIVADNVAEALMAYVRTGEVPRAPQPTVQPPTPVQPRISQSQPQAPAKPVVTKTASGSTLTQVYTSQDTVISEWNPGDEPEPDAPTEFGVLPPDNAVAEIQVNDKGYPVRVGGSYIDPSSIVASGDGPTDEDGVGQG